MRRFLSRAVPLLFQTTISLCILVGWFMLSSAIAQEQQQTTVLDPDRNSKQNKHPDGATVLPLGGADENGTISYDGGDRTDWYTVQVKQDGELIEIDSRPSDAIAVAVTCDPQLPIYVAEEVLDDVMD